MPKGHIETVPPEKRTPKAEVLAFRVDELGLAVGPANEWPIVTQKDTEEIIMADETTTPAESTPAANPPGEAAPVAAPGEAAPEASATPAPEAVVPAAKADPALVGDVMEGHIAMECLLAQMNDQLNKLTAMVIQLMPPPPMAQGQVAPVAKSTVEFTRKDGVLVVAKSIEIPKEQLDQLSSAALPLLANNEKIELTLTPGPAMEMKAAAVVEPVAKDTAATELLSEVKKSLSDLAGRVEGVEKMRGVSKSVVGAEGVQVISTEPAKQEVSFEGVV